MGIEDVSREEAEALGVLPAGTKAKPQEIGFNKGLQTSVHHLDREALDSLEVSFGDQIEVRDESVRWRNSQTVYRDWAAMGRESARSWTAVPEAPPVVRPERSRERLQQGFEVSTADGRTARFDAGVLQHWEEKNKSTEDVNGRLARLEWAVDTVGSPSELWSQEAQNAYVQAFANPTGGYRGCIVYVRPDGRVRSYLVRSIKELDKARKGLAVQGFGGSGSAAPGEPGGTIPR